jgi:hypothetical protein
MAGTAWLNLPLPLRRGAGECKIETSERRDTERAPENCGELRTVFLAPKLALNSSTSLSASSVSRSTLRRRSHPHPRTAPHRLVSSRVFLHGPASLVAHMCMPLSILSPALLASHLWHQAFRPSCKAARLCLAH